MREGVREHSLRTLRQTIHVWLDQYPEDFQEPPNYPCLSQLEAFCRRVMPDSELDQKVNEVAMRFEVLFRTPFCETGGGNHAT